MGCSSSQSAKAAGPSKRLLEEYSVGQTLGEGAFGVVYACTNRITGEELAVKMVDKVETPAEAIKKEADMLKSLSHANIVRLHSVFFEKCFVCIVMDKFSGGDLVEGLHGHLKEKGKINCHDIVHVSTQMGASISYLHSKSIVHRDVKGDNFLMDRKNIVDPKCHIALGDFGTAYNVRPNERLHGEVGTRIFWSPEMFRKDYGLKVDVWAMGVIMYGLLDGRFPFKDEQDIKKKEPKIPKRVHPDCVEYIQNMLQKDENKRISSDEVMECAWLTVSGKCDKGNENLDLGPQESVKRMGSDGNDEGKQIRQDSVNDGVAERRRELVERLNNEHQGKQTKGIGYVTVGSQQLAIYGAEHLKTLQGNTLREHANLILRAVGKEKIGTPVPTVDTDLIQWILHVQKTYLEPLKAKTNRSGHWMAKWFTIVDKHMPGATLRFEWWTNDKVLQSGILNFENSAGPLVKGDEKSPQLIGQMLQEHDIDVVRFGLGEAKTLEQLADEVQRGAARLMLDAAEYKKLVRVVDVVLLRLYSQSNKSKILIETAEQYPDGRTRKIARLPGTKKEPHESAKETASRIVKELLVMGDCDVRFDFEDSEVFEEENDSPSFPGVKTVYRKEIVGGYVNTTDTTVLARVGLPQGTVWQAEDSKKNVKYFSWMTEKDATKKNIKLRAEGSEHVSGLVMAPIGLNEEKLRAYLIDHKVKVAELDACPNRGIKELSSELVKGESSLMEGADGSVIRVVDLVVMKIVNPSAGDVLIQTEKTNQQGVKETLNRLPAAKRRPDENQFLTARRLLRKQLKIDENYVRIDAKNVMFFEEAQTSGRFPGIRTVYRKRLIKAELARGPVP